MRRSGPAGTVRRIFAWVVRIGDSVPLYQVCTVSRPSLRTAILTLL
jgi:hypothetical protein